MNSKKKKVGSIGAIEQYEVCWQEFFFLSIITQFYFINSNQAWLEMCRVDFYAEKYVLKNFFFPSHKWSGWIFSSSATAFALTDRHALCNS